MVQSSQPPRRVVALLALLVAVSFGLRTWEASRELHSGATWDEHYSMRNLGALLNRGQWQLFDLEKDPRERRDVKADHREPFAKLKNQLEAWMARVEGKSGLDASRGADRQLRALGYL